jgi:hypothetical protein
MTDEQWVDLQSVEIDQEWLAIVKHPDSRFQSSAPA